MLPTPQRLRRSEDFDRTVRGGVRAGRHIVVVHMTRAAGNEPARAGLVVSKAVGNSVVRSKVKRRLREALRPIMADLPDGTAMVVRALPGIATATWDDVRSQVMSGTQHCLRKLQVRDEEGASRAAPVASHLGPS